MNNDGLDDFINNCTISDFSSLNETAIREYIAKYLNENTLDDESLRKSFLDSQYEMSKKMYSEYPILICFVLYAERCKLVYKHIIENKLEDILSSDLLNFICRNIANSCYLITSINTLLLATCNQSVITEYRTFYENYVILKYIYKNQDLISKFNEHAEIRTLLLERKLAGLKGQSLDNEKEKRFQELTKENKEFKEEYGWTVTKIKNKQQRNIDTLHRKCGLDKVYSLLYKEACEFAHASSYGVQVKPDLQYTKRFLYVLIDMLKDEFEILLSEIGLDEKEKTLLHYFIILISEHLQCMFDKF